MHAKRSGKFEEIASGNKSVRSEDGGQKGMSISVRASRHASRRKERQASRPPGRQASRPAVSEPASQLASQPTMEEEMLEPSGADVVGPDGIDVSGPTNPCLERIYRICLHYCTPHSKGPPLRFVHATTSPPPLIHTPTICSVRALKRACGRTAPTTTMTMPMGSVTALHRNSTVVALQQQQVAPTPDGVSSSCARRGVSAVFLAGREGNLRWKFAKTANDMMHSSRSEESLESRSVAYNESETLCEFLDAPIAVNSCAFASQV
eukprot:4236519-Pleurochrysis_carterae.AAC.2